jgi:antitoxin CptB
MTGLDLPIQCFMRCRLSSSPASNEKERPDRMNDKLGETELRRRRLLWRAMHRGLRELDLILGGFATVRLAAMNESELAEFEAIVASADSDLHDWIIGSVPVPGERMTPTMAALLAFRPQRGVQPGGR